MFWGRVGFYGKGLWLWMFWQEKREEMGCFVSLGGWSEVREERIPY